MQNYNLKFKIIKLFFIFLTFNFAFLTFNLNKAFAFEMGSAQYKIEMGNINMGSAGQLESPESGNLLSDTLGQLAANKFNSFGYIIKAGFQYIHSIVPFSFSISDISVDFGDIQPNSPETATADLTVSFGGGGDYQVTVAETSRLTSLSGLDHIDDTNCDAGCDENTAGAWISPNTYGFGYKMSGEDIPDTFTSCGSTCYRRFADISRDEEPVIVMSSSNVTVDLESKPKDIHHQATITFKLNVEPVQPSGSYQTIINFIAVPSY